MRVEPRRQSNDCVTWALALYLGKGYDEVWQTVVKLDRSKGKNGLHTATALRVAKKLGHVLRKVSATKITDDTYGVIMVTHPETAHAAVVRNGLVFDVDMTVWDLPAWLTAVNYTIDCVLTEEDA